MSELLESRPRVACDPYIRGVSRLLRTFALVLSLLAVSLAGACASNDQAGSGSQASGASDSPVAAGKSTPAADATRSFTVDEARLAFDLPADWKKFDQGKMREALSNSSVMDDLNSRVGVSREQFQQLLSSNIVVFLTAPQAVDGFLDNVNVGVFDQPLPGAGVFELQYRALGATHVRSKHVSTKVGDGFSTAYILEAGGQRVQGQAIALEVDGRTVVITVSSSDGRETDDLVSGIRDSLAPAAAS